jgi:hypothetical protein
LVPPAYEHQAYRTSALTPLGFISLVDADPAFFGADGSALLALGGPLGTPVSVGAPAFRTSRGFRDPWTREPGPLFGTTAQIGPGPLEVVEGRLEPGRRLTCSSTLASLRRRGSSGRSPPQPAVGVGPPDAPRPRL